ncbi:MAG: hypothetical protein HY686_04580 [Chloroflexi bacterium]|nr:hypothetical protein [Chloroflexota bacterium]
MTRRKDRDRIEQQRKLNPDYRGFRGVNREPDRPGNTPLVSLACSACGRKRNVPLGVAQEFGERYVCLACREEAGGARP